MTRADNNTEPQGMLSGSATLKNSLAIPENVEHTTYHKSSNPTLGIYLKGMKTYEVCPEGMQPCDEKNRDIY